MVALFSVCMYNLINYMYVYDIFLFQVFPSNNPLDKRDFNPIDYINELFPSEQVGRVLMSQTHTLLHQSHVFLQVYFWPAKLLLHTLTPPPPPPHTHTHAHSCTSSHTHTHSCTHNLTHTHVPYNSLLQE